MNQEEVLQIIKLRGPIIPSQISKELGTNILLASAILSEFSSRNLVKISNIKIGGSPLYYIPGQEERLLEFMDKLGPREKEACSLLRENKILRDTLLEPVTRVALRQCKDFAKPLEATINGQKEIFWKWYLVPNDQAEQSIRKELTSITQKPQPEPAKQEQLVQKPKAEVQHEKEKPKNIPEQPKAEMQLSKPKVTDAEERISKQKAAFEESLKSLFNERKIKITEEQTIRKNSEMAYVVKVPSAVGDLSYLVIAKNKKCNEADISYAYVQGQIKKLPVLLIGTGDLTKKAKDLMQSTEFTNMTFIKV